MSKARVVWQGVLKGCIITHRVVVNGTWYCVEHRETDALGSTSWQKVEAESAVHNQVIAVALNSIKE